ncbi:MAG: efflux RND transporter periplasmic adaptor subunit [Gammaproteobacteria bacterium]|nr:efflux RND transporter periplasmic adaptor subunit [Gammaproteobacteria bacterium]
MESRIKTFALSTLLASVALIGCSADVKLGEEAEAKKKEEPAVPVEVAEVVRGDINAVYSNTTTLEAEEEALVVAKASEIITDILVEEGDSVVAGQVLARLNTEKMQLELMQAQANLKRLKAELDRNQRIYEKKMVSSDVYERLKFDYQAQQAAYELAKLQLDYGTIRAPISGVVSERMIKVGNMVKLNDPLFRISDFDPLLAVIHVPERELFKIQKGQFAQVKVDANLDKVFAGQVLRISPVVDATSGTFKVTVEVNDPDSTLRSGMFGRVNVVYANHKDTLLVSKAALIAEEDKPTVFVVSGEKAEKQAVKLGFENSNYVEITSGLDQGDLVVTAGQNSLKNASKVNVLNRKESNKEIAKLDN